MIAINDNYADSRDMSWLWDVDFSPLKDYEVCLTTGSRAADMALRLQYDEIKVSEINEGLDDALAKFCQQPGEKLILSSYTAMLQLYKTLTKQAGKTL
jgi:UDP-N-acetylmuramyl tripeptide synthase